jgi:hypothetical protein
LRTRKRKRACRLMIERSTLGIFAGAGFAKWAAGLPIASELFDSEIEPFGSRDPQRAQTVHRARAAWLEQHPDGTSEQFIAYAMAHGERLRTAAIWYITRRVSEPYIWQEWHAGRWRRHVLMIDENRKYERPGVTRTRDFLLHLRTALSGIITTNYDLLVEYALGTQLFNYGRLHEVLSGRGAYPVSQWRNPVTLRGQISLAKVHGSISWTEVGKHTDGRGGITGKALIVAPTPEKTPPPELKFEWQLAGDILQRSKRLIVFGFAFNPFDEALLRHLGQHGQDLEQVILVDPAPKIDRAKALWPHASLRILPAPLENEDLEAWNVSLNQP